jgi:hypothetical protein
MRDGLLRSPFIVGGHSERAQRALADRRLRDEQRDRWNWFEIERWAALTDCSKLQVAARDGEHCRTGSRRCCRRAVGPRTFTRSGRQPDGRAIAP